MKGIIKLGLVTVAGLIMSATALTAQANEPPAEPNGCTGHYTVQYKKDNPESTTGIAIGGAGDKSQSQAHSEAGRGQMVKDFHDQYCGDNRVKPAN